MVKRANQSKWCLLIDTSLYVEPGDEFSHQQRQGRPEESYNSYFKPDWIQSLFSDGKVHAPVRPEWQPCCSFYRAQQGKSPVREDRVFAFPCDLSSGMSELSFEMTSSGMTGFKYGTRTDPPRNAA